jgi:hypothetical protein
MDFKQPNPFQHLREHPNLIVLSVGVLLLIVGAALLIAGVNTQRRTRPSRIKQIAGRWTYTAVDSDAEHPYSYSGTAEITQDGQKVTIHGWRNHKKWQNSYGQQFDTDLDPRIRWWTIWGLLDEAGDLRYDYFMEEEGRFGQNRAYAVIHIGENKRIPRDMVGTFYILPPSQSGPVPNTGRGTIDYRRVAEKKANWIHQWFHREEEQGERHSQTYTRA